MLKEHPFWGYLAMQLEPTPTDTVPIAATNGKQLLYNPEKMQSYGDETIMAVITHEIGHVVLGHLWRRQNRDNRVWLIAIEYPTNELVKKCNVFAWLPDGCLYDDELSKKSAEEVYDILIKHADQIKTPDLQGCAIDEGYDQAGDNMTPTESEWMERIAQATQVAKQAGKLPGHLEQYLEGLFQSRLHWSVLLRRFTSSLKMPVRPSWSRPRRRLLAAGLYIPKKLRRDRPRLAVGLDVSGSISDDQLKEFVGELYGMQYLAEITLIMFDVDIRRQVPLQEFLSDHKITGRGGTDFRPVFKRVEQVSPRYDGVVMLTDGYAPYPEHSRIPTLWVMNSKEIPPFGWHVRLKDV